VGEFPIPEPFERPLECPLEQEPASTLSARNDYRISRDFPSASHLRRDLKQPAALRPQQNPTKTQQMVLGKIEKTVNPSLYW